MDQRKADVAGEADCALNEEGIKILVLRELRRIKRIDSSSIIANEYPLGNLGVRADLAVYAGAFTGIEIKSAYDGVRRLDRQIGAYRRLFDKTIIVLASKHVNSLRARLPCDVEIWEVSNAGRIQKIQRTSKYKPSDATYLQFMTKSEVKRFASNSHSGPIFRAAFFEAFKDKFGETSANFWKAAEEAIDMESLSSLSRFKSMREKAKTDRRAAEVRWEKWLEILTQSNNTENQSFHASSVSYSPELSP